MPNANTSNILSRFESIAKTQNTNHSVFNHDKLVRLKSCVYSYPFLHIIKYIIYTNKTILICICIKMPLQFNHIESKQCIYKQYPVVIIQYKYIGSKYINIVLCMLNQISRKVQGAKNLSNTTVPVSNINNEENQNYYYFIIL